MASAPRLVPIPIRTLVARSEEHTSELQSLRHLVCRLLLAKTRQGRQDPVSCRAARYRHTNCPKSTRFVAPAPRPAHLSGTGAPRGPSLLRLLLFFKERPPPEFSPLSQPAPRRT